MQGAYIGGVDLSDLHVRCASTQIALPKAHCLKTFTQRGIWLNELPDMVEPRMGLMVLPDSRQMLRYGDSALLQLRLIADAGLHHQQVRRIDLAAARLPPLPQRCGRCLPGRPPTAVARLPRMTTRVTTGPVGTVRFGHSISG